MAVLLIVISYKGFVSNYEIQKKGNVLSEKIEATAAPTLEPTASPSATITPTKIKIKPTHTPTPVINTPVQNNSAPASQGVTNQNPVIQTNQNPQPTSGSSSETYEEWAAKQPRDSQGNMCGIGLPQARCKYECSVGDSYVDDGIRVMNNHIRELQSCQSYSTDCKIWEDAVMSTYNMVYDWCINSPIFHPQNPL